MRRLYELSKQQEKGSTRELTHQRGFHRLTPSFFIAKGAVFLTVFPELYPCGKLFR